MLILVYRWDWNTDEKKYKRTTNPELVNTDFIIGITKTSMTDAHLQTYTIIGKGWSNNVDSPDIDKIYREKGYSV